MPSPPEEIAKRPFTSIAGGGRLPAAGNQSRGGRTSVESLLTEPPHFSLLLRHGQVPKKFRFTPHAPASAPLISCMMPTRGKLVPARFAIECFRRQSYPAKELVVVCRSPDSEVKLFVETLGDPAIRAFDAPNAPTVGDLRNEAVARSRGEFVATWDDDDLYHPERLTLQMNALQATRASAGVLRCEILWWPAERRLAVSRGGLWENSMLARRDVLPTYPSLSREEDTKVIKKLLFNNRFALIDLQFLYVRIYHGGNIWDADHFARFFDLASVPHDDSAYAARLAELGAFVPIQQYADAIARGARV
jgi:glycosyltransferase involved in cell wall biosynthesis